MSYRPNQVAQEIMKGMSHIIHASFPIERYGLITVTDVVVTKGCENAKIFISSFFHSRDLVKNLNQRVYWLTNKLKDEIILRRMPSIKFVHDISTERVARIEQIKEEEDNKKV